MGQTAMGVLLRFLRDKRGLSLREVAQLAGVDLAYIHRLETGAKESPSEEVLSKLIRTLRAEKREADMLHYLAVHTETDTRLVEHALEDPTVTYEIFTATAGASFRGVARPNYPKLVERVRRILSEDDDRG